MVTRFRTLIASAPFYSYESSTDKGVYKTVLGPSLYLTPGTYYWQMKGTKDAPSIAEYQSPIYTFVVTPKSPPPSPPAATS